MRQKVIIMFWWESGYCLRPETISPLLETFRLQHMLKIVFRDSLLYPKQLSLFCLVWPISASADRIGYITEFYSMIELLHELKYSNF